MPSNEIRSAPRPKPASIDDVDRRLLAVLASDARRSNKELAAQVGLAPSTCHQRLRRLIDSGIIRGFHADIDPEALGVGIEALVSLRLARHSRDFHAGLREFLVARPEVVTVYNVSGRDDFLAHVVARDTRHLRDLVVEEFAVREEVAHVETMLLFESVHTGSVPQFVDE